MSVKSRVTVPAGKLRGEGFSRSFAVDGSEERVKCVRARDWHASSRAWAKACACSKRDCGSLARALSTTCSSADEIVGILVCKSGGGTDRCWLAISRIDPEKGGSPLSHS